MVALPGQLFYSTQIPVCLWFLTNDKTQRGRDRRGETLFIDARQMGSMVSRVERVLTDEDIARGDGYLATIIFTPEGVADPAPWYRKLREEMPVFRSGLGQVVHSPPRVAAPLARLFTGEKLGKLVLKV